MTSELVLVDAEVRDDIRRRIDLNMCVEAGAGTGKTTVLVDRIIELLKAGHAAIHELVVITFTEKAAAELAGRVREGIERARRVATLEEQGRLDAAIGGLTRAHIETIHAFATSLLRERPVEAGLDPGFEVLTELPAQLDFDEAYDEWVTQQLTADEPPPGLLNALDIGVDLKHVRAACELLHRRRELLPLPAYALPTVDVDAFMTDLEEGAIALSELKRYAADHDDAAYREALRVEEMRRDFAALRGRPEVLRRAIVLEGKIDSTHGNQQNWAPAYRCGETKAILNDLKASLATVQGAIKQNAIADLVSSVQGFVSGYADRRLGAGKADFDDLLIRARDLVRDDAGVRRYFQAKHRRFLVDEFQDTDPVQVELIVRLCAREGDVADWRSAPLRDGALFVVGDPKQSIYRFRGADITTYDLVKAQAFGAAGQRQIAQNFRSAEPIVAFVNRVFGRLFERAEGVQPAYADIAHRGNRLARPEDALTFVRGSLRKGAPARDRRTAEAASLAGLIHEAVDSRTWPATDGEPATYGDIVVLMRTRTEIEIYEDALARAGVPYRHEGGRSFFGRQEVRELVALLRAIDDPTDAVAAVAALRSPAFGCSDQELFEHKRAGGSFDHGRVREATEGAVGDALRTIAGLAAERAAIALPAFVRRVLDRSQLVELAMLHPQGDQAAANLLKVIDQARAFAAAGGGGLRAFVRWLRQNVASISDEADAPVSEDADDVVRIMTVHGAKGLEFPVVVLANMDTAAPDTTETIVDRGTGRLHVKLGSKDLGFVTPGFDDAKLHEDEHRAAEQGRLLYVAATRAQYRLVIPLFVVEGERPREETPNAMLRRCGAAEGEGEVVEAAAIARIPGEAPIFRRDDPLSAPKGEAARVLSARSAWHSERDALRGHAATPLRVVTASALEGEQERRMPNEESARRGRARDFGVAVHALLERADLGDAESAARLAPAIAAEFGLRDRQDEIEAVARNAVASPVVARALRSRRRLREVAFIAPLDRADGEAPGLADGRIDLLFEEGGALVIVDFKTDAVTAGEVARRAEAYGAQAQVYAWAAARATGMRVREVVFVFARPGAEHAVPVDDVYMVAAAESLRRA